MNDGLVDAFRHDAWAMRELLRVCGTLSDEQLNATVDGTYGSVIETLRHIVTGESRYCARVTGEDARVDAASTVGGLLEQSAVLAVRWERYLTKPVDAERTMIVAWPDGTEYEIPDGVHLAQALHHGNEHRAQICTILTSIGVAVPSLGVWDYAEATGRMRPATA